MPEMTHRQRVQASLNHQSPDLVPVDFGTGGNTSPVPEVYKKLTAIYKLDEPIQMDLVPHMMRLANVDERILQDLDIDTRPIYMNPILEGIRQCEKPGFFYDEWGVMWKEINNGGVIYREVAESPLAHIGIDEIDSYPWWPDPLDPSRYAGIQENAQRMFQTTDYALIGCPAFNSVWERAYMLCGFARMLEGLLTEPDFVNAVFQKVTGIVGSSLEHYLDLVGPYIQVVKMGDDLGGQENALMSPAVYRRTIKPYHQELFQLIKQRSPARVFLHTCGSIYKLLPDLLDAGVEILNPVQVSAQNMDTQRLKSEFGDRLSFWGAIDTQHVLPKGSVENVKEEVQKRIADLAMGGGYVVAPVHNVQADVPAENIIAMYRAAREFGRYPLPVPSH